MDLVCFSHLRWNFVYQRPQHLLSRFAKELRVFFIEEPLFGDVEQPTLESVVSQDKVTVVTPRFPKDFSHEQVVSIEKSLLKDFFSNNNIAEYICWYYTPMALELGNDLSPECIVYDCMDELSNFKFAPTILREREKELFKKADIVFTGGHNLYKHKKSSHHNIYPFPSSIDRDHFAHARDNKQDPEDQKAIPHPRFGFYGVIDERMNLELLREVAQKRPEWHLVIIGPVVKIDESDLPRESNIHYLGGKDYKQLPSYLSGWDVAMIPFELNESTEFISPTKTPEYLAAGKPVISTSIIDVVTPYGEQQLVSIADSADEFIEAAEFQLNRPDKEQWLRRVDRFLALNSWDKTWSQMMEIIDKTLAQKKNVTHIPNLKHENYV
jgi:glycosyltransferase involved in cell wall biosynthesis